MHGVEGGLTAQAFADYFGISKDTLLYYDRTGLFSPDHIADNGYRVYTSAQIEHFWALLVLRDSGVPIKELKEYFDHPNPELLGSIVEERIDAVDEETRRLHQTRLQLEQMQAVIQEIDKANKVGNQILFEEVSIEPMSFGARNEEIGPTSSEAWNRLYDEFVAKTDLDKTARVGSIINKADLLRGNFSHVECVLAITPKRSKKKSRKPELAAVRYWRGPYESVPACYPEIISRIESEGLVVAGNAREEYLSTRITAKSESEYLTKITVPVKKSSSGL